MRSGENGRGVRGEEPRKLGLCVLCGLPASGKSTCARALGHRLREELGWAVGVVAYDDVMPDAFPEEEGARPLLAPWKLCRRELLSYLESLLDAAVAGAPLAAPPQSTDTMWSKFVTCLKTQDLLSAATPDIPTRWPFTPAAVTGPLLLILDDNFYYQSMRYEIYQLARRYSLGFCQLFFDCPLDMCLARNARRARPVPAGILSQMAEKLEKPNPEKNSWEHHSLTIPSTMCASYDSQRLTEFLLDTLDHPVKAMDDQAEQKETDRIICSNNVFHQTDQILRRIVSQTMKAAKDEQVSPSNLKFWAEDLNKLKAEFLEDLRQGNKKYLCCPLTTPSSNLISCFSDEKNNIVHKYIPKNH
ncbi:LOW QUALITY PROTEIN: L-seryl-tRNA(Sec) kinase [Suncus etruscus]|uniref:LOW QUALITY PROTEIN: L-seryl-tRNA(Sec) kinase n=1 Tax=Suncus etruscus TaxID=109475 RepID=UPI00211052B8|nr:LOW QUALITY PROTEIN: L-seryl-tRNA(Sec) kinase [Suncus etruscus]